MKKYQNINLFNTMNCLIKNKFIKKKYARTIGGSILFCIFLYYFVPRMCMPKPFIQEIAPETVMMKSEFNSSRSIRMNGDRFDNIVAVYVDGVWEEKAVVNKISPQEIEVILPAEYYDNPDTIALQIQTKVNSELFAMSNKQKFTVLSDELIQQPRIEQVVPDALTYNGEIVQRVTLEGTGFNENSVVMDSTNVLDAVYDGQRITVYVPFSSWYGQESISLKVVQYYGDYATSIESDIYELPTTLNSTINMQDDEEVFQSNLKFMLEYLEALQDKENYCVFFAVRDESCCAVVDEIVEKMHAIGLSESLKDAGVHMSYIAVLDGQTVIYEEISPELLTYEATLSGGGEVKIKSANFNVGNMASIIINETEYCVNRQGLNIVVYDKDRETVVDSVAFNTYQGLGLSR